MWDAAPGGSGWSKTLPRTSAGRGTGDTPFLVPVALAISASPFSYSYTHYVSLSVPSPLQLSCPCSPHPRPQNPNSLLLSASSRAQKLGISTLCPTSGDGARRRPQRP